MTPMKLTDLDHHIRKARADAKRWPYSPASSTLAYLEDLKHELLAPAHLHLVEQIERGVSPPLDYSDSWAAV